MSNTPLRSPKEVARDFVLSWEDVAEKYFYEDDELRDLLRNDSQEANRILEGTDKVATILADASDNYFTSDDKVGLKIESHDSKDGDGNRIRLHEMLADPSLFDRSIGGRTTASKTDHLNSRFGALTGGIAGCIVYTPLLFMALLPIAIALHIDLVGTRLGGTILLGCVVVVMLGTELWHRFISYERPYYTDSRDGDPYESGVKLAKWYLGCSIVAGVLYLYISFQGESIALTEALSGGMLVILARAALGLSIVSLAVLLIGLFVFSPGFGAWPAAYRSTGKLDGRMASPVQLFFTVPLFLFLWGLLGGDFYSVAGLGPALLGGIGIAAYPLTGAIVARLMRLE